MDYPAAQERVYGMPIEQWKRDHQIPASDEQLELFEQTRPQHARISGHQIMPHHKASLYAATYFDRRVGRLHYNFAIKTQSATRRYRCNIA